MSPSDAVITHTHTHSTHNVHNAVINNYQ